MQCNTKQSQTEERRQIRVCVCTVPGCGCADDDFFSSCVMIVLVVVERLLFLFLWVPVVLFGPGNSNDDEEESGGMTVLLSGCAHLLLRWEFCLLLLLSGTICLWTSCISASSRWCSAALLVIVVSSCGYVRVLLSLWRGPSLLVLVLVDLVVVVSTFMLLLMLLLTLLTCTDIPLPLVELFETKAYRSHSLAVKSVLIIPDRYPIDMTVPVV